MSPAPRPGSMRPSVVEERGFVVVGVGVPGADVGGVEFGDAQLRSLGKHRAFTLNFALARRKRFFFFASEMQSKLSPSNGS